MEREGWTPELLREAVDLFVLHYDGCGTSRACFRVLQDERQLSVHFLLDVDGTIYQTLDLREQAWHARQANPRSIGVEIANVGAFPPGETEVLEHAYGRDERGAFLRLPPEAESGVRTPGFHGRPARPSPIRGAVQGRPLVQYDFTPEQLRSLVALARTLTRAFPRLAPDAPRGPGGRVLDRALSDAELAAFHGILGHHHVSPDKVDPGPAFDWERFLAAVREPASPRARRARPRREPRKEAGHESGIQPGIQPGIHGRERGPGGQRDPAPRGRRRGQPPPSRRGRPGKAFRPIGR